MKHEDEWNRVTFLSWWCDICQILHTGPIKRFLSDLVLHLHKAGGLTNKTKNNKKNDQKQKFPLEMLLLDDTVV